MRLAYAALAGSAYVVLLGLCPFFDPNGFPDAYRWLLLVLTTALLWGIGGFICTFAPNDVPGGDE